MAKRTPLGKNRRAELGVIDYTLAKRALLRDAKVGVLGLTDICDAHPELLRAAKHVGEPTRNDCPVCGKVKLVLLAYVYGEGLRDQNGRVWSIQTGLKLTAAHPGLPMGSKVKVVNLANDQEVVVIVNDRCRKKKGPHIDLSRAAARKLGYIGKGMAKDRIIRLAEDAS